MEASAWRWTLRADIARVEPFEAMLKIGPLIFCLGVSLLFHALVFGVVKWAGAIQRPPALQQEREVMTLHLVAAPAAAVVETGVTPLAQPSITPPEPVPTPIAEPPPPEVEQTETTPLLPKPVEKSEPVQAEPPPTVPVAVSIPPVETRASVPTTTAPARGDGSSRQAGDDAITSRPTPGVLAHPNYLKNPEPVYPVQARRRQQQGTVLLEVKVSARGRALQVLVKESSGYIILDEAALNTVRDWEFEPARMGTVAVDSRIEVPVRFLLAK